MGVDLARRRPVGDTRVARRQRDGRGGAIDEIGGVRLVVSVSSSRLPAYGGDGLPPCGGNLIYPPRGVISLCAECGLQTSSPLQSGSRFCFCNRRLDILTTSRPILATGKGSRSSVRNRSEEWRYQRAGYAKQFSKSPRSASFRSHWAWDEAL